MTELPEGTVLFDLRCVRQNGQTIILFDPHPDAKLFQVFKTLDQMKKGVLKQANEYFVAKGYTDEMPAPDEETNSLTYRMIQKEKPAEIIEVKPKIISLHGK